MSSVLYRLGRAVHHRWRAVLLGWLVALLAVGGGAAALGGSLADSFTIPGTESQEGLDVLQQRFPQLAGASGQILLVAPQGSRVADAQADVDAVRAAAEAVPHVVAVSDPFDPMNASALSPDGRHAIVQVQLDEDVSSLDQATIDALTEIGSTPPPGSDLEMSVGGSIFTTRAVHVSPTEGLGLLVALVVLIVTFGSLLAAGLPILTAILGVGVAMAGILAVAAFTDISTTTPTLALMIGLAVGIDYALFLLSRHRAQLARGMAVRESVAEAVATAGSAVIFAGATVIIALCGLMVAGIPFLSVMGFAAAGAVAVAVAVALTALPALLAGLGERLRPREGSRAQRHATVHPDEKATTGARWVALVTRAPWLTVAVVVLGLITVALPARDLQLALPDNSTAEEGSDQRVTFDRIAEAYGPGYNTPLLVTVDIIRTTDPLGVMAGLADDLGQLDGVAAVGVATPNATADLGIVQIIPEEAQAHPSTAALVREIRDARAELEERYDVTDLRVTGATAVAIDVSDRLAGALVPFAVVVVGLSLILLMLVFRSIWVPVKATLGYLLSVAAAFGVVAVVFSWGWFGDLLNVAGTGPVISFLPIILMGVLFGLAMDYEVFLVSRMREDYVRTKDAQHAVRSGFAASARVVTAAAIIMIAVFAAFVPESDAMVKPIALGLAVGVFVDAFLVRMTLVPAVLALLGDRAWRLPRRLDRALPELDVEGAALEHHLAHEAWVAEHGPAVVRAEAVVVTDERDVPVIAGASAVVRAGGVLAVRCDDAVARRALLAALAGRLRTSGGTLVVLDRVLPDEIGAVRARVPYLPQPAPGADWTAGLEGRPLVVVDLDTPDRWAGVLDLAEAGVAVVVGVPAGAPLPDGVVPLDLAAPAEPADPARPTLEPVP